MYDTIFAKGIASFRAGNHFKICPLDNFTSPPLVSPSNLTLTSIHPFFILTLHELSRSTNYSITFHEEIYIYIYNFFLLPKIVAFISEEDKDEEEKYLVSFSFFSSFKPIPLSLSRNSPVTDRFYETFQHLSSARSSRLTTNYVLSRPPPFPPRVLAPNLTRISLPLCQAE